MQEMQETWVLSLGWEDPLEKEMATHSSNLAKEERSLVGYSSWRSQTVRHGWVRTMHTFQERGSRWSAWAQFTAGNSEAASAERDLGR